MAKSDFSHAVDQIQNALKSSLRDNGFKGRGRTFNRTNSDGLTQVVSIQMGAFDPPGALHIPGLRDNLFGKFAVNLGVYVPEVARYHGGSEAKSWIQEYNCCIRARLGALIGDGKEVWWHARADEPVIADVQREILTTGFSFLERYSTRDHILAEYDDRSKNTGTGSPPRIVMAIILAERGEYDKARTLLSAQAREALNPGHPAYIRGLAQRLRLDGLDG